MGELKRLSFLFFGLLLCALAYTAFAAGPEPAELPKIPFLEAWTASGHADKEAEAFAHWNNETPAEVPVACAKCHSEGGFLDFLGVDGSASGAVDKPAPIGTAVTCVACHNQATIAMNSVVMPSGVELAGLRGEARCMQCHQGRASTSTVNASIEKAGLTDNDTVSADLGFTNIHYFAAAATMYGTQAQGGYQYDGKSYDAKFAHVLGYDSCTDCHSPHSLEIKLDDCKICHTDLTKTEDLRKIRTKGSTMDYDGDGKTDEGMYYEIQGLRDMLYGAMKAYAKQVSKIGITYDPVTHPYFFIDINANGRTDPDEAKPDNKFNAWTGRLAKAAYNYQTSLKDPGAYAHGGKYIIELLYDSIDDLNQALTQPVNLSKAHRVDAGHFAGSEEAFRHWDAEGTVPGDCTKCHTGVGLPFFLKEGVSISQPPSNGLLCSTCHDAMPAFTLYNVESVKFPSGASLTSGDAGSNLCLNCHQGRQSTVGVNAAVDGLEEDAVSDRLSFLNVHYLAAGATRFGTEAKGAYEYAGKEYNGLFLHTPTHSTCTSCHGAHNLEVKATECGNCHPKVNAVEDIIIINMTNLDFDGDGNADEGIAREVGTAHEKLLKAIQDYASSVAGSPIAYDSHVYPYFFIDTNKNGKADTDEAQFPNRYNAWTPRLLKAAYNYQYVAKDPGAAVHNGKYIFQVLYDSLENLGEKASVDMANMVRPKVPEPVAPAETPEIGETES